MNPNQTTTLEEKSSQLQMTRNKFNSFTKNIPISLTNIDEKAHQIPADQNTHDNT